MNYFKRLLLALVLLLSVVAVYAGGIKDAKDLVMFVTTINKGGDISAFKNDKGEVCLEADIDMAKVKKLAPVKSFGGVFNGQGFALKNWKAQNGLFHELLEGGTICNLRIDASCAMKAQNKGGECFVGWIANINNGKIENCENHAPLALKSSYTTANVFVGAIVGSNRYVVYRCRNYGAISSEIIGCMAEVVVRMGGIAGGGWSKHDPSGTTARCENYGEVSYGGDAKLDRVGGIIGEAFRLSTKFCINRGAVSSASSAGENGQPGTSFVAGIAAYGKHDIICSDNFGNITAIGSHSANIGGIAGMPHSKLVIADCTNYGKVEGATDSPSNIGGIVGNIGREVHIVNGVNRGHVHFAGSSPSSASCVGGIVGNIYTTRGAKFNAYLRRCNNFGTVESLSGGNNYENHDKAIHTGGIVGRANGGPTAYIHILDCTNKGTVKATTGRKGNIAGMVSLTEVKGEWFDNNYAQAAEPMTDGANIYGRVTNNLGEPVAGCVVSDGKQCVQTDANGNYAIKSDMANSRFVFISIPDGYKLTSRKSVIQNFRRIPRYAKGALANFTIERRTEPTDKYTVIMIGDPQMRGLGHDGSGERYRDVVLPDIEEFKKSTTGEFFSINLGDLVYNWMAGYDDYMDINTTVSYPVCHIIGNHDYDQQTILEGKLGTPFFEQYITPTYYSFTIGKIHYVMINSIEYSRENGKKHYRSGLDDEQMQWLEEDLKYIPKDYTIYICGHAQLFKKKGTSPNGSHGKYNINYKRYTELLKQYKRVYSWSGHYHTNYGFDVLCKIAGISRATFYYQKVHDRNYQMRSYSPTRTGDGYVKVNIWNYSKDNWSPVEWWVDGKKVGEFEKSEEFDPDYLKLHAEKLSHLRGRAAKYAQPQKSDYIFRIKPSEGVRSGEIRVTDNFGVTYTEKVEW